MQIAGERILILGDSLTHHGLDAAPPVWDVDAGSQRASSAPGDLLASMLLEAGAEAVRTNAKVGRSALSFLGNEPAQDLLAHDATWRPSKVIVMLGTNDAERDLAKTEAAMTQIRDAYRGMGAEVYAIGPMTYVGRGAVLNAPANNVFAAMQRVFGVDHTVDARPLSGDFSAERSADGIHFTAQSAPVLAARLLPEVKNTGSVLAAIQRRPLVSIGVGFGVVLAIGLLGIAIRRRQTVGKLDGRKKKDKPDYDIRTGAGQKRMMYEAVDMELAPAAPKPTGKDWGADPIGVDPVTGKFMFRMHPSGDVVDKEEKDRRLPPPKLRGAGPATVHLGGYRVAYGTSAGYKTYRAFDPNTFSSVEAAIKRFRVYKRQGLWAWVEDEQGNFVPVQGAKLENVRKGYPLRSEDEIKQLVTGHLKT